MPQQVDYAKNDVETNREEGSPFTSSLDAKTRSGGVDHGIDVKAVLESSQIEDILTDTVAVRRLVRKIDFRLIPCLALCYSFALIDRVNLPNARIAGMDEDLELSVGSRYSLISMIFFVPYIVFQFPSNIAIRKLGAMWWLPSLVVCWGAVMIGFGFTHTWDQLLGLRVILGILEAGFYPGCVFLLSCWYVRYEVQKRFSAFYLMALLSSGFSSILAYGLMQMKGLGGLNGWRWIFIMEGIVTCLLGFMLYFAIIDFPDKATKPGLVSKKGFLSTEEAAIALARIQRDRGDAVVDKLTIPTIARHLKDWKVWEFAWLYLLNNVVTYSFGFFLPIILRNDMGFSVALSQVLSFPPYVFAAIVIAYIGDRTQTRGPLLILNCLVAIVGVSMMAFLTRPRDRYAGVFLGVAGANTNVPSLLSYMHNNIVGQMKRSISSALLIGGGAIGGIAATNIFRQQDAPAYTPAMITVLCTQAVTVLHVLKNFWVFKRRNAMVDRGEGVVEGQVGFKYTL
ncbi:hypothetical protein AJ79_01333 [Helicocarpus griseus UAMH5409]|uniref:Major facilitator superfamily (MFS) profile domain-containing protein n=1 Tax=Helicocarpus griseus UAMH5409 TaxID=1447875 RepID=A0A2B7Y7I3_9EURO|nr:hypothetical protein AJ79_01333 [Helicocarpus griseus UAMH5409]